MKKKLKVISLILAAVVVCSISVVTIAYSDKGTQPSASENLVPIYAKTSVKLSLADFVNEGYDENETIASFSESGWVFQEDYMYRVTRLMGGNIRIGGKEYILNSNGFIDYNVPALYSGLEKDLETNMQAQRVYITEEPIATTMQGELEQAIYSIDIDGRSMVAENSKKILIEEDLVELFDLMEMKNEEYIAGLSRTIDFETPPYGPRYKIGDPVHCNRFNGPDTDDVHYAHSGSSLVKAMRNFRMSDCDKSLDQVTFCRNSDKCNQLGPGSRGACSTFTAYQSGKACPKSYHTHAYEFAKFDVDRYFSSPWYGK